MRAEKPSALVADAASNGTEAAAAADFSILRYAQSWEDADVLVAGLDPQPGDVCLSIGSGGDNSLALLSRNPARVIAVDMNPAQIACLELRVAAYRELQHAELLELNGSRPSNRRPGLYQRCRPLLSGDARNYWDTHSAEIEHGIGGAGKFERYFGLFRNRIMPLVHSRARITRLLQGGPQPARESFYVTEWDTWRWRLLFKIFFSRLVMGRFGRDPAFFQYVEGKVGERILSRARYGLTALNPAENPYLQWILTGTHTTALPLALRAENYDSIRRNLGAIEWVQGSVEQLLEARPDLRFDAFNLSDIFEYMCPANYHRLLERIVAAARPGARLAYWNMLATRRRPESLGGCLRSLDELALQLFKQDKAWFYSAFILEEVAPGAAAKPKDKSVGLTELTK